MGMLTKHDLSQIGELMNEKFVGFEQKMDGKLTTLEYRIVDRVVGEVGEMLEHNILPQLDGVTSGLTRVEATMVTKERLDEKIGELRGEFILKSRLA
jgi:hypothetical protein